MKKQKHQRSNHVLTGGYRGDKTATRQRSPCASAVGCECGFEEVFPRWFPVFVTMVTMCIRIYYVIQPRSWWILHPDEIYQSLEIAFGDVYGHGFLPYEYLPPPPKTVNLSAAVDIQEAEQEMYSLRSSLFPDMFSLVFKVAAILNLDQNPFLVGRIFNAAWTSLLPLVMFSVVNSLFRCRLMSSLACVLIASSLHLTVYGTHTIINSFIAPPFFLGILFCIPRQEIKDTNEVTEPKVATCVQRDQNGNVPKGKLTDKKTEPLTKTSGNTCFNRVYQCTRYGYLHTENGRFQISSSMCKQNGDIQTISGENDTWRPRQSPKGTLTEGEDGAVKLKFTTIMSTVQQLHSRMTPMSLLQYVIGGALVGVTCYVRVDLAAFLIIVCVPLWVVMETHLDIKMFLLTLSLIGFISGYVIGGFDDYLRYGYWFISPYQWFQLNFRTDIASSLFGAGNIYTYLDILFSDSLDTVLHISALSVMIYSLVCSRSAIARRTLILVLLSSYCILIFMYSITRHKEGRFLYNVIVFKYICISYSGHSAVCAFKAFLSKSNVFNILLVTVVFIAGSTYQRFPCPITGTESKWTYYTVPKSNDLNTCLNFIGQNTNDVTGVMLDSGIYSSAGYTLLKHDVPILTKVHFEFHVYRGNSTTRLGEETNLRLLKRFTDYMHIKNHHYLAKVLTESNEFNYVVTNTNQTKLFLALKYREVFRSRDFLVFRRRLSDADEYELNVNARRLPIGINATVLEYESSWLLTAGLYQKARFRLETALELSKSRVRVFQQLRYVYEKLGMKMQSRNIEAQCINLHGLDECAKVQDRVVLDSDYRTFE